jgi:tetratricopeptide (TPR) repeat protein
MVDMTPEQLLAEHQILRADPQKYLVLMNERIEAEPGNAINYFRRHSAWNRLGRLDLALGDLTTSLQLEEKPIDHLVRGEVLFRLARYDEALSDLRRGVSLDADLWAHFGGPLYEAECHIRLGDGAAALAVCADIPEGHWSPGLWGIARGNKAEITAEIGRRVATT